MTKESVPDQINPPQAYQDFTHQYPKLLEAWEKVAEAGNEGPLDEKTIRIVKLAIAIGALREGAVRAGARKALSQGIRKEEIDQIIALATSSVGFPATVAVFSWVQDVLDAEA